MVHISPGKMLPARRVVQLIPKIAVAAVPQEMNETGRDRKTHGDCLFSFEPFSAIQTDGAHRFERACFLLDDCFPFSYTNEIHDVSLLWSNEGSIFADERTRTRKLSLRPSGSSAPKTYLAGVGAAAAGTSVADRMLSNLGN